MSTSHPHKSQKKRISTLRISTDSLPEYNVIPWQELDDTVSSDYPDSAEEADEDTEEESPLPHHTPRFPLATYRRKQSADSEVSDQYLDSLLERSVHALEMSNALLQSSISTQSSLSAVLASDSAADHSLETQAMILSLRIRGNGGVYKHLVDDLDEITRGVEGLFGEDLHSKASPLTVSSSLPTSGLPSGARRQNRKRPSLDLQKASAASSNEPQLHFCPQTRDQLVSPPPRALTQYWTTADSNTIVLPSTLGLRASPSCSDWRPMGISPSASNFNLASLPMVTDRPVESSTPVYNRLSSFVSLSTSPTLSVSSSRTNSPRFMARNRNRRGTSTSTERTVACSPARKCTSPDRGGYKRKRAPTSRSRSTTPKRPSSPPPLSPSHRFPPILEIPSSPSPPSSDESCCAKLTVQSLRKILDDQSPVVSSVDPHNPQKLDSPLHRPPAFLPLTPPPGPTSSTSTATASISRLFTKATHSSSTRPPPPPAQSSMKQHSAPATPTLPSPTLRNIPELLGGVARVLRSSSLPGSGRTTPKRISFAELPESYASSRGPGSPKFRGKRKRTGMKISAATENSSWWLSWLISTAGSPDESGMRNEIFEDRMGRGWGKVGNGFDEWSF